MYARQGTYNNAGAQPRTAAQDATAGDCAEHSACRLLKRQEAAELCQTLTAGITRLSAARNRSADVGDSPRLIGRTNAIQADLFTAAELRSTKYGAVNATKEKKKKRNPTTTTTGEPIYNLSGPFVDTTLQ